MTDWIMTASGRPFWPLEPRIQDVCIEDIAHHLSHLCRFTGAVRLFYSVAQHSVEVSREMAPARMHRFEARQWCLYGLLHDASEAYLMDVPRPLKHDAQFAVYRVAETRLQRIIYAAFGLDPDGEPDYLKYVDQRMLRTEQRDLMPPPALAERRDDVEPFSFHLTEPWSPARARWTFLERFAELTNGQGAGRGASVMPQRLQRRRAKGWRMPPGAVYVGRPTKWGNPFVVGRDGTVAECLELYRLLAGGMLCLTTRATPFSQDRARKAMEGARVELRGKDLLCWCRLDRPCHADVLLEIANGEREASA